jgi:VCBS repeat-containing protein
MQGPLPTPTFTVNNVERTNPFMNPTFFGLRRAAAIAVTSLLTVALVACSADDGGGETTGAESTTAAESAGDGGTSGGTATVTDGAVEMSADNLEFDVQTIEATAGEAFTITFTNNDSAPHNVAIYTEEGGDAIVQGEIINGGESIEIEVPAQEAGEYYFMCDVHPDMNGTVVVS